MIIHLVLYSNNEPFDTTKQLIIESIDKFTQNLEITDEWEKCDIMGTISYKAYQKIDLEKMNNIIMKNYIIQKSLKRL